MSLCEICNREPPRGDRIRLVPHHASALKLAAAIDWSRAVVYSIATCGREVCVFRARVHGVPGAVYTGFMP